MHIGKIRMRAVYRAALGWTQQPRPRESPRRLEVSTTPLFVRGVRPPVDSAAASAHSILSVSCTPMLTGVAGILTLRTFCAEAKASSSAPIHARPTF